MNPEGEVEEGEGEEEDSVDFPSHIPAYGEWHLRICEIISPGDSCYFTMKDMP